ncbi:MAG: very short patch repair endonuclease [Chloroflexota bacterium]|nr:very short patch repair endonuclease [Chloroflexota bacterium]MDE2970102.1 very short patch repair endonuclease [Chloroflexota bacterium]
MTDSAPTADKVTKAKRSWIMSRVHSKRTSPEIATAKALHAAGFRFRLHRKDLPGKPDIVLPKYRVAVMVHGCLWHGHQCKRFRWPVANADYWRAKIERNVARDATNTEALRDAGWTVKVVWDCQLKEGIAALLKDLG